ncbi:MAG: tRNA (adenosine(37)-N6)-dimethylallyltransferase MiaA [Proteobacteria bacterium]|nr:tRNA (adenosine(37)-N6)-dimethylallyltransferase MiaA [Pseudomonadota bacterium]
MDALVIAGPTASGKTALALAIAHQLPVEIINMDSALVYQGMDIGTAKPSLSERSAITHHLVDIKPVTEAYSAAEFVEDVERLIPEIRARGKLPVIVGGTILYLHSWLNGLSALPSADAEVRAALQKEWEADPIAMHARLVSLDPVAGNRIHPNDPQRILRALEVITLTGVSLTEQQQQRHPTQLNLGVVLIEPPSKPWLHERIACRWDQMIEQGLVDEVKHVMLQTKNDLTLPAMRCVGYRQIAQYLLGELDATQMREQALSATRSLAKRQLTWMKKIPHHCLLSADMPLAAQLVAVTALLSNDKIS